MASAAGSHAPGMEKEEVYDPMNLPDVDKYSSTYLTSPFILYITTLMMCPNPRTALFKSRLNASYIAVHGRAMLGRPLWLRTSSLPQSA
jgi:hypothetical protein